MLELAERGQRLSFSFEDLLRYHGPGSPGGVAHAFKVLERALPLLEPEGLCERRELAVATAFGGPGARDAIEMATRAVTDGRFEVTGALERPELGRTRERDDLGTELAGGGEDQALVVVIDDDQVAQQARSSRRRDLEFVEQGGFSPRWLRSWYSSARSYSLRAAASSSSSAGASPCPAAHESAAAA